MRPDDWHLTRDVHDFLARAGEFLRSRRTLDAGTLYLLRPWWAGAQVGCPSGLRERS